MFKKGQSFLSDIVEKRINFLIQIEKMFHLPSHTKVLIHGVKNIFKKKVQFSESFFEKIQFFESPSEEG